MMVPSKSNMAAIFGPAGAVSMSCRSWRIVVMVVPRCVR